MIFIPVKKWKAKMFGNSINLDVSSRLLMQSHFALIIITLLSAMFNYILDLGINLSITLIITSIFYFVGYRLIYSKNSFLFSFIIFITVSVFLIIYIWIFNGGIDGGNLLLVFAFYTILLFISRTKYAVYVIILYLVNTTALFYFEFNYPQYIVGYNSEQLRYIDIIIVSYSLFLLASPMLLLGKKMFIKAKERAEESEKSKMQFLANISHDIRTPLNAIIGFTDLLNSEGLTEADRKVFTQTIKTNSENLLHMVTNILNLSQIDSGILKVEKSFFSLNKFLEYIYESYSPLMISNKVEMFLENELQSEDIFINSDQNLIYQVLTNLLNNSIKFTKEGEIVFGAKMDGGLMFFVRDTGVGIPVEMQDVVFDRFKQVGKASNTPNKGVGLGLAICSDIVSMLGGKIELISESSVGTTISFTIPIE